MKFNIKQGTDIDLRVCDFIVGLDRFDVAERKKTNEAADPIISFVLSQKLIKDIKNIPDDENYDGKAFDSYADLAAEVTHILDHPDVQACPMTTKLMGCLKNYIDYMIDPSSMSMKERQFKTAQINVKWVNQNFIDEKIEELNTELSIYGKTFKTIGRPEILHEEIPANGIESYALDIFKQGKQIVEALAGRTTEFTPTLIIKDFKETWKGWIEGEDNNFRIKFNQRVAPKTSDTELTNTAAHELCGHGMQFSFYHDQINEGELPLFSGISTMVDPQFIQAEGLAEIAPVYLSKVLNDFPNKEADSHFQTFSKKLYINRLVTNNMAWLVHNRGYEEALQYGLDHSPEDNAPFIRIWADDLASDPLYCSYNAAYGAGQHIFRVALETLPLEKFEEILGKCYTEFLLPSEINDLMREAGVPEHALFDTTPPESNPQIISKPALPGVVPR